MGGPYCYLCHYFKLNALVQRLKHTAFGPKFTLPGGDTMTATKQGSLNIPELTWNGKNVHVFPNLQSANLLSIGQLFDDGCIIIFHNNLVLVNKHNKIILLGIRNKNNGMWEIPLPLNDKFNTEVYFVLEDGTLGPPCSTIGATCFIYKNARSNNI